MPRGGKTASYAGGAVIFGILMSRLVSDALTAQPGWIRITATALAAGVLAAVFILVANRLTRK